MFDPKTAGNMFANMSDDQLKNMGNMAGNLILYKIINI